MLQEKKDDDHSFISIIKMQIIFAYANIKSRPNDRNMPTQHIATLFSGRNMHVAIVFHPVATCWVLLALVWKWSNLGQQHPTHRNTVAKRTQHVTPSNVAICCVGTLRWFGRGFPSTACSSSVFVSLYRSMAYSASSLTRCFESVLLKIVTFSHQICDSPLKKAHTRSSTATVGQGSVAAGTAAAAATTAHATTGTTHVSTANTWNLIIWFEARIMRDLTGI